jgi:dTDP-4-dehydrorhamnose reductase
VAFINFLKNSSRRTELTIMRILVTGASGRLGSYLVDELVSGPHQLIAWSHTTTGRRGGVALFPLDLADGDAIARALETQNPDAVIHAAGISSAEAAHRDPARCQAVNVLGTQRIADWTAGNNRRLIFTSTDLVFDGLKGPYSEDDPVSPVLEYGRAKRAAEEIVLANAGGLVARISLLYGPSHPGREGFFDRAMACLQAGTPQTFFADEYRTPIDYVTASRVLARLAGTSATGLVHLGGRERVSRYNLMRRCAAAWRIDPSLVRPNVRADVPSTEARPADVSLDTTSLRALISDIDWPGIEDGLMQCLSNRPTPSHA